MATINIKLGLVAAAGGTVDAITATYNPAVSALADKTVLFFVSAGANTSTTPTFSPNGLTAHKIVKKGGQALVAGDIAGAGFVGIVEYNLVNTRWELLNPASEQTITGTDRQVLFFDGNNNPAGDADFTYEDVGLGLGKSLNLALNNFLMIGSPLVGTGDHFILNFDGTDWVITASSELILPTSKTTTQAAGDNSTKIATTAYADNAVAKQPEAIAIACSDLTTALTTGTSKGYIRMPFAMTLTSVRASVIDAPTGASLLTVDINEAGSTILSTKITIDASEKTSTTAATPAVISDTALANDAEITIDIDQIGSTNAGKGLIVYLIGTRT